MKKILFVLFITLLIGIHVIADVKIKKKGAPSEPKEVELYGRLIKEEIVVNNKTGKTRTVYILEADEGDIRLPRQRKRRKRKKAAEEEMKTINLEDFIDQEVKIKAIAVEIERKRGIKTIVKKLLEISANDE